MDKRTAIPDLEVLGDFANTAAKNARRLLGDAEILARRRRWPLAYSAAVLAFEEAGKAWTTVITMMVPDSIRPEFPFRELVTLHQDKLMAALTMAKMLRMMRSGSGVAALFSDEDDLTKLAREHNLAKQRGFYTDIVDGAVWDPASINRDETQSMIGTVRRLLDESGPIADPEFIASIASGPEDMRSMMDNLWAILLRRVEDGPEKMAAGLQTFMDETGATQENLRQMMEEMEAERVAAKQAAGKRSQPRRLPPRANRRNGRRRK